MRPFGCPVTILNTIDHLGKFDGKANEGFFIGYSLNNKAFRVFNSRTRIVEENLHIRLSESIPNIVGSGPNWLFDIVALTRIMIYEPIVADLKNSHDDGKKVDKDPRKDSECNDQEKEDNVNSTNNVNATGTNKFNAVGGKTSIELPFDLNMPALEDYSIFNFSRDDEDDGAEANMNNLDTTIQVSPNPTTRIQKDHPLDQIEAIKEVLLQFKLQEVWTLVDLPNGKRAIGSKWVFRNKKDERGIVIRNKARLVTQGYRQEERNDKVFALVARIEAIGYNSLMLHKDLDLKIQAFLIEYTRLKKHCMDYIKFLDLGMKPCQHICWTICFKEGKLTRPYSSKGTKISSMKVKQKKDGIFICQDKYVKEILKKFGFIEVKTTSTPMESKKPLLKDEDGEEVDVHMYRSMIGSLMYLTSSRPDIMFAVCACARYQVNPKVSHLHVVKRIFRLTISPNVGVSLVKLLRTTDDILVGVCFVLSLSPLTLKI
ncbi:putative ribonuclease H-like domain-containing protein [Tanacetum coccineum]